MSFSEVKSAVVEQCSQLYTYAKPRLLNLKTSFEDTFSNFYCDKYVKPHSIMQQRIVNVDTYQNPSNDNFYSLDNFTKSDPRFDGVPFRPDGKEAQCLNEATGDNKSIVRSVFIFNKLQQLIYKIPTPLLNKLVPGGDERAHAGKDENTLRPIYAERLSRVCKDDGIDIELVNKYLILNKDSGGCIDNRYHVFAEKADVESEKATLERINAQTPEKIRQIAKTLCYYIQRGLHTDNHFGNFRFKTNTERFVHLDTEPMGLIVHAEGKDNEEFLKIRGPIEKYAYVGLERLRQAVKDADNAVLSDSAKNLFNQEIDDALFHTRYEDTSLPVSWKHRIKKVWANTNKCKLALSIFPLIPIAFAALAMYRAAKMDVLTDKNRFGRRGLAPV